MASALQIEKRNALLNEQCRQLTELYKHDGLSTCILKGQGNLLNYPEHLRKRRQCGDIDVWTVCKNGIPIAVQTGKDKAEYVEYHGRKAVMEYVRMQHRLVGAMRELLFSIIILRLRRWMERRLKCISGLAMLIRL